MDIYKKYSSLISNFIAPNGTASMVMDVKNTIERWYTVKGTDSSKSFDGINWSFPLNLFSELNSDVNSLEMKFQIVSKKDQVLQINMNYNSETTTLTSKEISKIFLKQGVVTDVYQIIPTQSVDNAVSAMPLVFLNGNDNVDFSITGVEFKPNFSKKDRFKHIFEDPQANGKSTLLSYSKIFDKKWITALVPSNTNYGGILFDFPIQYIAEYANEIKNNQLIISFDMLTNVDLDMNFQINLRSSDGAVLDSNPISTVKTINGIAKHYEVSIPSKFEENVAHVQFILMNVAGLKQPFTIKASDFNISPSFKLQTGSDNNTFSKLPIVNLTGDVTKMTKKNSVTMEFEFRENNRIVKGFSKTKWQGDSSLKYPKKNYRIKLYSDFGTSKKMNFAPFSGWKSDDEFNLKASYNDATFGRNIINSQLFADITANRTNVRYDLTSSDTFVTVKGKPILVYINGIFHGLYTFNTTKYLYNMDKNNNNHIVVGGCEWTDATLFKTDSAKLDETDFEIIQNSGNDEDTRTKFNRLMKFINSSTDEDFIQNIHQYLSISSVFDYMAFMMIIQGEDNLGKNTTFATWDGNVWNMTAYDLDTSWSMKYDGTTLIDAKQNLFNFHDNRLFLRIRNLFKNDFKKRYFELRSTIMTPSNIISKFDNWYFSIGQENLDADKEQWHAPSYDVTNMDQIRRDVAIRLNAVDAQINQI